MKYSHMFARTNKVSREYASKNATLLIKAGFIDQTMAGVYSFLPLGQRVLAKIEQIIREEMDKVANEVFLPSIVPTQIWEDTNRINSIDVLFQVTPANEISKARHDSRYILNCTHEDVITPIAKKFHFSYKDLPVAVYQIQTKFRNEPRAKSGLMRGREFRMKDLYSFHVSEADLLDYYEKMKPVYMNVFKRVGLGDLTLEVAASGGDFTENFSHEFQTRCETGEDTIFLDKKSGKAYNLEIAPSQAPQIEDKEAVAEREDILGENIIGVSRLAEFLKIPVEKTTKTMIYQTDTGMVVAAAVRGGYDINEEKLRKVLGVKKVTLADEATVKRVTGAEVGYAGLIGLPEDVKVVVDESCANRINFECGANKTHYHSININWGRDLAEPEKYYDIKMAKAGDLNPETGEVYEVFTASEVGNIFPLNTKFSDAIEYTYTDEDGTQKPVYMGSYGIGSSRLMGVIAEIFNDEKGLKWPVSIAPYDVYLISFPEVAREAEALYQQLLDAGVEVLWDDRDIRAGQKFADADLVGIPVRLVLSKKTEGKVEWKNRNSDQTELVGVDEVIKRLSRQV